MGKKDQPNKSGSLDEDILDIITAGGDLKTPITSITIAQLASAPSQPEPKSRVKWADEISDKNTKEQKTNVLSNVREFVEPDYIKSIKIPRRKKSNKKSESKKISKEPSTRDNLEIAAKDGDPHGFRLELEDIIKEGEDINIFISPEGKIFPKLLHEVYKRIKDNNTYEGSTLLSLKKLCAFLIKGGENTVILLQSFYTVYTEIFNITDIEDIPLQEFKRLFYKGIDLYFREEKPLEPKEKHIDKKLSLDSTAKYGDIGSFSLALIDQIENLPNILNAPLLTKLFCNAYLNLRHGYLEETWEDNLNKAYDLVCPQDSLQAIWHESVEECKKLITATFIPKPGGRLYLKKEYKQTYLDDLLRVIDKKNISACEARL